MEHERPHLDRAAGDVGEPPVDGPAARLDPVEPRFILARRQRLTRAERGFADVLAEHEGVTKHAAAHGAPPTWLVNWEVNRPVWAMELLAEAIGGEFHPLCRHAA